MIEMETLNKVAIKNFCDYLRIKTVPPKPDYASAVEFLKIQAKQLELKFDVFELVPENPIVFLKWKGSDETLKSVVVNSHMDVVPVFPEHWKYDPFSAHIDDAGNIYARGAQDMKCVGIQYLEAIRRIKMSNPSYIPKRNVHVLFVPDEELGGEKGMFPLVNSEYFKKLNVGIVMDEGLASPSNEYAAFYGDRLAWWIKFFIYGPTGHGSQFLENTAGEKMGIILDKFMKFRHSEKERMTKEKLTLGDVTTINMTGCSGGVQHNVVPDCFTLDIDMRITPNAALSEIKTMIDRWIEEAGGNIKYKFVQYDEEAHLTDTSCNNAWWNAFESACKDLQMNVRPQVFPASTDSSYVREKGIPAIGFSPMNNTPILLHDHNEFLNSSTFLRGIDFYEKLIPKLASVVEK